MVVSKGLAEQVLDLVEETAEKVGASMPVRFEELTADVGELPRIMLQLSESDGQQQRYLSGERICPMPFALTLRFSADDQQTRLDARELLGRMADAILEDCMVLNGYVAYALPTASVPVCLGKAPLFEDWQVTFDLKYKQSKRKG